MSTVCICNVQISFMPFTFFFLLGVIIVKQIHKQQTSSQSTSLKQLALNFRTSFQKKYSMREKLNLQTNYYFFFLILRTSCARVCCAQMKNLLRYASLCSLECIQNTVHLPKHRILFVLYIFSALLLSLISLPSV